MGVWDVETDNENGKYVNKSKLLSSAQNNNACMFKRYKH